MNASSSVFFWIILIAVRNNINPFGSTQPLRKVEPNFGSTLKVDLAPPFLKVDMLKSGLEPLTFGS